MSSTLLADRYPETRARCDLNRAAEAQARGLIQAGKVSYDEFEPDDNPTEEALEERAGRHLGINYAAAEGTPERHTHPYGARGQVYVEALRACRSRSCRSNSPAVYAAAGQLLDLAQPKQAPERAHLPPGYERRSLKGEIRLTTREDGKPIIQGYAAVYGPLSDDLGGFRERVQAGCFRDSLQRGDDVRAFFNHNPSAIIGRMSAGTLRCFNEARGLRYEIDPPDTTVGKDLCENIRLGNIRESSFGFNCTEDRWSRDMSTSPPTMTRDLVTADLFDVSPVTFAAYRDTSVALRSLERAQPQLAHFDVRHYLSWLDAIDASS